jgi:signal transduction histidine kinase/DNA-binding response OmpR family regulator
MGLPPGDYELIVTGENSAGIKTINEASVQFKVLPPWWLTHWAYAIYFSLFSIIVSVIVMAILRRQKLEHQIKLDRLEKQKNEELIQSKMNFFTDITHEIRTPLTLIISTIEIIQKKIKNKKEQHELNIIYRNAIRLLNLMNQLLHFRKLELGKITLNIEQINLVPFIKEVINAFEFQYIRKNITLVFKNSLKEDNIWYDKQKLEIILYNIFSNAIKYVNEKGEISVEISEIKNENKIKLTISNTGKGIPPEQLPHIFDKFYRGSNHTIINDNVVAPSMGIGLALTKSYVELHNGKIYVESIENKKTSFTIEIFKGKDHFGEDVKIIDSRREINYQLISADTIYADVDQEHVIHTHENVSEKKPTLLIVEDNSEIREVLDDFLEDTFEIFFAEDGRKGLKLANEILPNIILCDIMMPGIDGLTLCSKLKNNINTSHIPIVLLTAKITTDDQIKGLKCGADDYILKPFNPSVLKLKLMNIIKSINKIYDKIKKEKSIVPAEITRNSLDKDFIQKTLDCINKNMQDSEFDLSRFSQELGMSERNLQLKLKSITNQSPIEFIRTIRLNQAAELLKEGKLNVSQIAYEVGFNTTSYFTKCFKIQFGMTPTEYIKTKNE